MKVLIADEQSLFRDGLTLRLKEINQNIDILQSSSLTETLQILSAEPNTDILILDIDLAGFSAEETIKNIQNISPSAKIIAISSSEDAHNIKNILSLGAKGYIPKRSDSNILSGALKLILDGGTYIPPVMLKTDSISKLTSPTLPPLKKNLTNRQSQVLDLIAQGKSNKQIAEELNYSIENVKKNLRICFKYFNVKNRVELVRESLLLLHYDFNN